MPYFQKACSEWSKQAQSIESDWKDIVEKVTSKNLES
jgi:hypothetical protein